ncbi:HDOD domain-containing protein [Magnetococcus sp. PR-3]|uniref:HDOD domain-containing protein n=1 Tax=Magnetococcus sp. PR-3 TaxID=3120355 RepID=UPI002FCE4E9B
MTRSLKAHIKEHPPLPLPRTLVHLRRELDRFTPDLMAVAEIIERDGALTGMVLGATAHQYRGGRGRIREAVVLLGLSALESLLGKLFLEAPMVNPYSPLYPMAAQAHHQALRMVCCLEQVTTLGRVQRRHRVHPQLAHTAGLMQGMGRMALVGRSAEYRLQMKKNPQRDMDAWMSYEQDLFGYHHRQMGAALCRHWRLPESVVAVVANPEAGLSLLKAGRAIKFQQGVVMQALVALVAAAKAEEQDLGQLEPFLAATGVPDAAWPQVMSAILAVPAPPWNDLLGEEGEHDPA